MLDELVAASDGVKSHMHGPAYDRAHLAKVLTGRSDKLCLTRLTDRTRPSGQGRAPTVFPFYGAAPG